MVTPLYLSYEKTQLNIMPTHETVRVFPDYSECLKMTTVLLFPVNGMRVCACACSSLQGLFVNSVGTKTQMDCEFCVYKSLRCCFTSFLLRTAMGVKT